jgi:hypothetical protein
MQSILATGGSPARSIRRALLRGLALAAIGALAACSDAPARDAKAGAAPPADPFRVEGSVTTGGRTGSTQGPYSTGR